MYFECAVRYDKMMENGSVKKVTDKFLVDALTFTEAESRIIEERTPFISGEFTIPSIKKTKIAEIFNSEAEKFFLAKVSFVILDEKTGAEKKSTTQMLVGGGDLDNARANLEEAMKGTMADWELASLSESPVVDIFLHENLQNKDE